MATAFDVVQHFPAGPSEVLSMLQNEAYVQKRCESTGSLKTTVSITGTPGEACTVFSTRVLPADVPAAAKSFVGETIKVSETQEWSAADANGTCTASVVVDFGGPLSFKGSITLTADATPHGEGASTTVRTTGEFKASVPFIGGKLEKVACEQTERYLGAEEVVGREWLSR